MVDASPIETSRYERRNIKVINLKGKKIDYQKILNQFFVELKEMIDEESQRNITTTNEKAREEFILPNSNKRLCFISAPYSRISFLKELIYPVLLQYDITPITLDEAIVPGDNLLAKIETLLKESSFVIIDASGNSASVMWELAMSMTLQKKLVVIGDERQSKSMPNNLRSAHYLLYSTSKDNENFMDQLKERISSFVQPIHTSGNNELSLLKKSDYNAAVISAFRWLENSLRNHVNYNMKNSAKMSLYGLMRHLMESDLPQDLVSDVFNYLRIRNQIVHETTANISKETATDIVNSINRLVNIIESEGVSFNSSIVGQR